MDKSIADFCIQLAGKLGASYAEARLENSWGDGYALKNGIPEPSGFAEETGIGVRVLADGSLGFSATNKLDKTSIRNIVRQAVLSAKKSAQVNDSKISFVREKTYRDRVVQRQKIGFKTVSAKEKLAYLQEIDRALMSSGVKIANRTFSVSTSVEKKYFANSEGSRIYSETPQLSFLHMFTVENKSRTNSSYLELGDIGGWEKTKAIRALQETVSKAKALHLNLQKGVSAPREKIDVIVSPYVAGIIAHESCGHPFEADRIFGREAAQAGESFVNPSMIGTRIGTDEVTVVDDPAVIGQIGSYKYDDEGVKSRRKFLIKKGIITELLHNRETAAELGLLSNGSSRAVAYAFEPIVRMSNTFFLPGRWKEDELIKNTKKGVYIKSFLEWNIDDKRFNFKAVGNDAYIIRNGRLAEPVRTPAIELTTPQIYSSIDALCKKVGYTAGNCGKGEPMQGIPVTMGGPMLRLRGVKLGRR